MATVIDKNKRNAAGISKNAVQSWHILYKNNGNATCTSVLWQARRHGGGHSGELTPKFILFYLKIRVTTEPSDEGNLSLGFIQLRTHQHLQRNTTNAWYETSNHLTSTCDTND